MSLASYSLLAEYSQVEDTFITKEQAEIIASNYIKLSKNDFPTWKTASVNKVYTIYSSNNIILGYEASIIDEDGYNMGSIMVGNDYKDTIIQTYSEEGNSSAYYLIEYYKETLKPLFEEYGLTPVEFRMLGDMPLHFSIGVKFKEDVINNDFILQDGWFIFTINGENEKIYHIEKKSSIIPKTRDLHEVITNENEEYFNELLNGDEDSSILQIISSGSIEDIKIQPRSSVHIGSRSLFKNFHQETRKWNNSNRECLAGCAPVAISILLDYWDRNGYPRLINGTNNNTVSDTDVRFTINSIRNLIYTGCNGLGNNWYLSNFKDYITGRKYKSTVSNSIVLPFKKLRNEVDSRRPSLAVLNSKNTSDDANHVAVVYAYRDRSGISKDEYKVKTGWEGTTDRWYSRKSLKGLASVNITSASTTKIDALFDKLERVYPKYFSPKNTQSISYDNKGMYMRSYYSKKSYLYEQDGYLWYSLNNSSAQKGWEIL